jgi:capsule polysaccharide export protein KpsE/RkpR
VSSLQLDFTPYIVILLKRRWVLLINIILIAVVAWVFAFKVIKKEYRSEVTFFPPTSSDNTLGLSGVLGGFTTPSLFSENIEPEQIETIFFSRQLREKIILRYNLYKNYKLEKGPNKLERALKILAKSLLLQSNEKGGFAYSKILSYTLSAYHTSPDTAQMMASYAYALVDSTVRSISIDRARRNREFAGKQLADNKAKLDSLQKAYRNFQTENKAYDIPEQLKLTLKAYADLKSEEVVSELKIKSLENEFQAGLPELLDLKSNIKVLRERLGRFESDYEKQVLPSLDLSSALLPAYLNLVRDMEVQNQLILLLSKEFEQAKLQEAKNVSSLIILDSPFVPDYKARPKRMFIMAAVVGLYLPAIIFIILLQEFFRLRVRDSAMVRKIREALK